MTSRYDYIVVGAGSAGCVVAHRLAERAGTRVLLLEQGLRNSSWKVRIPGAVRECFKPGSPYMGWTTTPPQPHMKGRVIELPYGMGLGGSSLVNGMVYLRGLREDYDAWRDAGAVGWGYDDVLTHFHRLENMTQSDHELRGRNGPIGVGRCEHLSELNHAFLKAGEEAGFPSSADLNGDQPDGFSRIDYNAARGYRSSSAYGYLEQCTRQGSLTTLTRARMLNVRLEGNVVIGVSYLDRHGQVVHCEAEKETILCAGALGTPKLLMLSGIGPADHLRELGIEPVCDLPGVGANLHDHVDLELQWRCGLPVTNASLLKPHNIFFAGLRWLLTKTGPAAIGQCHTGAFVRSTPHEKLPNFGLMLYPVGFNGWVPRKDIHAFRIIAMLSRPQSRGRLRLRSRDPADAPIADPSYLSAPADTQALYEVYHLLQDLVRQPSLSPYVAEELEPQPMPTDVAEVRRLIPAIANPGFHYCGTCRMGESNDPLAVVTANAKVRGVERLRVVDGSIMPEVVSSNLNAPIMMIGEHCAELIRNDAA